MGWGAAVRPVQGDRPEKRGRLAGFRRSGRGQVYLYPSLGEGPGRRYGSLRPKWRAGSSRPGLPGAAPRSGRGGTLQRERAEENQGSGSAVHGLGRSHATLDIETGLGRESSLVSLRNASEIFDYPAFRRTNATRQGIL